MTALQEVARPTPSPSSTTTSPASASPKSKPPSAPATPTPSPLSSSATVVPSLSSSTSKEDVSPLTRSSSAHTDRSSTSSSASANFMYTHTAGGPVINSSEFPAVVKYLASNALAVLDVAPESLPASEATFLMLALAKNTSLVSFTISGNKLDDAFALGLAK
eukprot:TRINITY_DN9884_c0_g1_i1.p2 TRINITY_DN9884_c0_g1~~TRINITY_DN9884_c0_g1_i1.p2  ORF type:complete len:162 (-),score=46.19 TRINITY_DN9884_c0_g1_i1:419-904(-)